MRTLLFVVPLAGCISSTAVPAAMHPTATAAERSVGVAVGGAYQSQEQATVVTIPYAEGWIRHPVGPGQLSVNASSNVVRAGYRYDVTPLSEGFGLSIEPMVGGSYFRAVEKEDDPMNPNEKVEQLTLSAGLVPTLQMPVGKSFAFASAKFGFQRAWNLEADMGEDDAANSYVLGLSLGIGIDQYISFELAIHRIDDAEEQMGPDSPPAWLFVPTIGVRH
jgi:hypothetical protein